MNESDKKYAIIQTRASENDSLKQNILIVDDHPESLHQYERRHWTQDEIRLLKTVAAQMGIAIAQANLLEQDKQQRLKLQKSESSLAAAQKITHIGS